MGIYKLIQYTLLIKKIIDIIIFFFIYLIFIIVNFLEKKEIYKS